MDRIEEGKFPGSMWWDSAASDILVNYLCHGKEQAGIWGCHVDSMSEKVEACSTHAPLSSLWQGFALWASMSISSLWAQDRAPCCSMTSELRDSWKRDSPLMGPSPNSQARIWNWPLAKAGWWVASAWRGCWTVTEGSLHHTATLSQSSVCFFTNSHYSLKQRKVLFLDCASVFAFL